MKMKVKVHMDKKAYQEKPSDMGVIKLRLQNNAEPQSMELSNIVIRLENGHAISPAVMNGTKASNWQEQQLFMVDIDNDIPNIPILTPENAINICKTHKLLPAFYYPTYNDTPDKPKYRIAFVMDSPVTSVNTRNRIIQNLFGLFPQSDKSCMNADRFFLGTSRPAVICDLSARISVETILAVSNPCQGDVRHPEQFRAVKIGNAELNTLKHSYDFLSYLKERNGECKPINGGYMFKNCEICGHHDDLVYYTATNTFNCFSVNGEVGGSIIDYLIATEDITLQEAIIKLKYDLYVFEWCVPTQFNTHELPSFPIEQFPQFLKKWVCAVAENTATSVDMSAVSALAVIASTIQGKFEIIGKSDYTEPLNIYVLIIANPGERKSSVVKINIKDLLQYEHEENQRRKPEIERKQTEIRIKRQFLEKAIKKGDTDTAIHLINEIEELETNLPKFLRLIADNVTPEALTSLLADNNGVLSIFSTEGGIFELISGMYGNKSVNIDTLLKAHCGDPIRVDRKGREHETVDNPALTMLLSAQENVLEGVLSNPAFVGRGLTARLLYCKPASLMGQRDFNTTSIPLELSEKYRRLVTHLNKIPLQECGNPYYLRLDDVAYKVLEDFFDWLEPQLVDDLSDMSGWSAKLVGATLRFAGIIHCVRYYKAPQKHLVSADTMKKAIAIGKYFLNHAKYIFSVMGADKTVQDAKYIVKRLEKHNKPQLKSSEILRHCKRFKKHADMQLALDLLVEYGYIRQRAGKRITGGRPEGLYYELNPIYFGERSS
jgi:hypothetical protein